VDKAYSFSFKAALGIEDFNFRKVKKLYESKKSNVIPLLVISMTGKLSFISESWTSEYGYVLLK
jgi:hypothetical protein